MVEADLGISLANRLEVADFDGNVALLMTEPSVVLKIGILHPDRKKLSIAAGKLLDSFLSDDGACVK